MAAMAELERLCEDAERDSERIADGRIEELDDAIAQRHRDFDRLSRDLDPEQRAGETYRQLVARLREQGAKTVALLSSIRDEMAQEIGHGRQVREAAGRYATANRL
jgi:hypothetical protein